MGMLYTFDQDCSLKEKKRRNKDEELATRILVMLHFVLLRCNGLKVNLLIDTLPRKLHLASEAFPCATPYIAPFGRRDTQLWAARSFRGESDDGDSKSLFVTFALRHGNEDGERARVDGRPNTWEPSGALVSGALLCLSRLCP